MGPAESNIIAWSAAVCGAAVLALIVGLRGRRVDDHPICRRCGFDLFNRPETSERCPECGADLARRRDSVGASAAVTGAAGAGDPLLLLSGGALGVTGYVRARGVDVYQYKPVSWLMREMKYAELRTAAAKELLARLADRRMDDADVGRVVEAGLAHQADRSQVWVMNWGQLVEAANAAKRIDPQQWVRYQSQAADRYELEVRPIVRRGHPIPVRVKRLEQRSFELPAATVPDTERLWLDNVGLSKFQPALDLRSASTTVFAEMPPPDFHLFVDGKHEARLTVIPADGLQRARLSKTVEIVSDERSLVNLYFEEGEAGTVERSLVVTAVTPPEWALMKVTVGTTGPPVDLAFDARMTDGEKGWDLGWLMFPAKQISSATIVLPYDGPRDGTKRVDVILTPSVAAAECTVDFQRIWGRGVAWYGLPVAKDTVPDRRSYQSGR